jgi:hypothetical protein
MTFLTGKRKILNGELLVVKFTLQTIPGKIWSAEDVDIARLSYVPWVTCLGCIGRKRWGAWVVPVEQQRVEFHDSVYIHPNLRVDGWAELRDYHLADKVTWEDERYVYAEGGLGKGKKSKGKGKGKAKKITEAELDRVFGASFPLFPNIPRFWTLPTVGSTTFLWPPRMFEDWADDVARGVVLKLDDAPGAVSAGSAIGSNKSSPLSTPPRSPYITHFDHPMAVDHSPIAGPSNHSTALDHSPIAGPSNHPMAIDCSPVAGASNRTTALGLALAEQAMLEESFGGVGISDARPGDDSYGDGGGFTDAELACMNLDLSRFFDE